MPWISDKTCKIYRYLFSSRFLALLFHKFWNPLFIKYYHFLLSLAFYRGFFFITSTCYSFFAIAPYILFTGIIDPRYSPSSYQSACSAFNSGCGIISCPYTQVLVFLDFFTGDESAVISTFRFFPFAFFPSDCNSVAVDEFIGVSNWISLTVFLCFFFAFGVTVG